MTQAEKPKTGKISANWQYKVPRSATPLEQVPTYLPLAARGVRLHPPLLRHPPARQPSGEHGALEQLLLLTRCHRWCAWRERESNILPPPGAFFGYA